MSTALAFAMVFFFEVVSYNKSGFHSQRAEIVSKPVIFSNKKPKTTTSITTQAAIAANNNLKVTTAETPLLTATTKLTI